MASDAHALAPFPALSGNRSFLTLIAGQFVSRVGDGLYSLAAVWLVLQLTDNNPLASSAALAFQLLPVLLFSLVAGVLVDRWDRRLTMAMADSVRAPLVLAVPVLYATGRIEVWHIYAVSFVLTSIGRLFTPARQALLPDLVAPGQLVRANSVAEGCSQAAFILGPALAGLLAAVIGVANVIYLDSVTFALSALSLLMIRTTRRPPPVPRGRWWQEAAGGLRHLRATPVLAAALALATAGNLAFAAGPALLPVLVRGLLGGDTRVFGTLLASFFVGAVAGSAVLGRLAARVHRGRVLLIGVSTVGVATLMVSAAPTAVWAGGALLVLGAAASTFNVAYYSLMQERTPADLRGRVFAATELVSQSLRPLAVLLAGLLAVQTDPRIGIAAFAVAALAAGLLGVTGRTLREVV
jgi:MFS family permease